MFLKIKTPDLPIVLQLALSDTVIVNYSGGSAIITLGNLAGQIASNFVFDSITLRDANPPHSLVIFKVENGQLTKQ